MIPREFEDISKADIEGLVLDTVSEGRNRLITKINGPLTTKAGTWLYWLSVLRA